jgi:hypothetical protein
MGPMVRRVSDDILLAMPDVVIGQHMGRGQEMEIRRPW